jgi:class 3 adenylate cyclase
MENPATSIMPEPKPPTGRGEARFGQVLVWLLLIFSLGAALNLVSQYFDADSRLNKLIAGSKALPLREWSVAVYKCPTFKSELSACTLVKTELKSDSQNPAHPVKFPLSSENRRKITSHPESPTLLVLNRTLSEAEKQWLKDRVSKNNPDWPSQAQLVSIGSVECEAKIAGSGAPDFDPVAEPEKMSCFAQSRFSAMEKTPDKDNLEYFIAIGKNNEIGPSRWPLMFTENQYVQEVFSLDPLTLSSVVLWNLISLLMPIFVIAVRFVFKGQKVLNTLSDYAVWMIFYAVCIVLIQQTNIVPQSTQNLLSIGCIALEGIILTMLVRYTYCVSSGSAWSRWPTGLAAFLCSLGFLAAWSASKQSPQAFLTKSHLWRDAIAGGLGCLTVAGGFYIRQLRAIRYGHIAHSGYQNATDDFGSAAYFSRLVCVILPLMIFGASNLKEILNPTQKILKWEDLFFLPSQTALTAFFLGLKTRTSLSYGRNMKERLEALFTGAIQMQRALTPYESVTIAVTAMREALPAAAESPYEFVESVRWEDEQILHHVDLSHGCLLVPLHGSQTYKGVLRFDRVKQEAITEEEEHFLTTIARMLANHLENQESATNLEKMHQASMRFVPRDFLRLLTKDSLVEVNLGDHVESKMSVFFADIRNFTQISEGMTPAQNFEFINSFLTQIGPIIRHHGGFIDKYIGDAIMALFPESPIHAVRCAVDMQIALRSFNDKWLGLVNQEIRIGCGIHYGPMVLGVVGYAERLSGTVMSDAVNLASRLESLTKQYSAQIIVSEDVMQHMSAAESNEFKNRMLDSVRVKGRNALVTIYQINVPAENIEEQPQAS